MAEFEHGGKVGVLIPCHEGQEADWVLRMRIALRGIPALDLCLGVEVPPVDPAIFVGNAAATARNQVLHDSFITKGQKAYSLMAGSLALTTHSMPMAREVDLFNGDPVPTYARMVTLIQPANPQTRIAIRRDFNL